MSSLFSLSLFFCSVDEWAFGPFCLKGKPTVTGQQPTKRNPPCTHCVKHQSEMTIIHSLWTVPLTGWPLHCSCLFSAKKVHIWETSPLGLSKIFLLINLQKQATLWPTEVLPVNCDGLWMNKKETNQTDIVLPKEAERGRGKNRTPVRVSAQNQENKQIYCEY